MEWRTDMSFAPRPGYGEGVEWVVLAIEGSDNMVVSYWLPQDYTNREGGWFRLKPGEEPIAWFPISHPKPPKMKMVVGVDKAAGKDVTKVKLPGIPVPLKVPEDPVSLPDLPAGIPGITS